MPNASSLLAANLPLLVCPVCHASLKLVDPAIQCTGCGRLYPIVDGLPVLIASRATIPTSQPEESASNEA